MTSLPPGASGQYLESAIRLTDRIRNRFKIYDENIENHYHKQQQEEPHQLSQQQQQEQLQKLQQYKLDQSPFTPGLVEGGIAGVVSFAALNPIRNKIIRFFSGGGQQKNPAILIDIVLFVSQAMLSSNVAMYFGVLYGTNAWLTKCADLTSKKNRQLLTAMTASTSSSPSQSIINNEMSPASAVKTSSFPTFFDQKNKTEGGNNHTENELVVGGDSVQDVIDSVCQDTFVKELLESLQRQQHLSASVSSLGDDHDQDSSMSHNATTDVNTDAENKNSDYVRDGEWDPREIVVGKFFLALDNCQQYNNSKKKYQNLATVSQNNP